MKKSRCSLFVSILDVVLQSVWVLYRINKDEADESVVLVAFRRHVANAFFLKHSEEDRLSSNHVESGNMPSDIWYDDTRHYHVQSEQRRIQNPFKHLRWTVFV